jgi:hypothetical protein
MFKSTILALTLLVGTGCSHVRDAKRKMTLNPDAGKDGNPVVGMDGRAARESMLQYQKSYKSPPPAVNVINIGGAIGGDK